MIFDLKASREGDNKIDYSIYTQENRAGRESNQAIISEKYVARETPTLLNAKDTHPVLLACLPVKFRGITDCVPAATFEAAQYHLYSRKGLVSRGLVQPHLRCF